MLLTTGAVIEFVKFIQILCLIILPVLLLSIALTTFLHYRKKKKNLVDSTAVDLSTSTPEKFNHRKPNGEYILFDHSDLISEYKKKISCNQAKYTALKHDFSLLESRYAALAHFTAQKFNHNKNTSMENYQDQLPQHVQEEINLLIQEHAAEKKEMMARLEQLSRSYQSLEEENESLLDQINSEHATDDEKETLISKWKSENSKLKEKVAEQDYLKDILEEKKAQIVFLQNQLEQRIMQSHQTEQQSIHLTEQLQELRQNQDGTIGSMQLEIKALSEDLDQCRVELKEKQQQLEEKEKILSYTKEQRNEAQLQCQQLEEKLSANKQVMRRLYAELSTHVESEEVPVISLRAVSEV